MAFFQAGKLMAVAAIVSVLTAGAAVAQSRPSIFWWWQNNNGGQISQPTTPVNVSQVPEIDASAGLLALAAVAAAMVLVWELRRRRKARA